MHRPCVRLRFTSEALGLIATYRQFSLRNNLFSSSFLTFQFALMQTDLSSQVGTFLAPGREF
ncbi:hypothetical protein RchiOBHm_Chr7g0232461 [Rosa chinensis]|uniref:Uncharacterized protein n=1 Tax=Rosa chinensis TaxID=74649 RepID=A0A2P6PFY2_ROSCH|nr:hypothetical protein RchiOBHm_Chr7g0232461 [Rosa chinensis]